MKKNIPVFLLLAIILIFAGSVQAEEIVCTAPEVQRLLENNFSCIYEGIRHNFILDLPEKTEGAPLVLMLPGYGRTAESFRDSVHFERDANPQGYAVVYVIGARDPNDSTSSLGWNSGIAAEGNDDVGFLVSLTEYLHKEYALDRKRTFAVGFSNGAFMIHRLAMEAADTFSALVSVAGAMPVKIWEKRNEINDLSFFQITGEKDYVVPKHSDGSAQTAKDPAIEDVMEYWAASNGLDCNEFEVIGNGSTLTKCRKEGITNQVWSLFVRNGRHSWPGVKLNGIDTNSLILEFFSTVFP